MILKSMEVIDKVLERNRFVLVVLCHHFRLQVSVLVNELLING